jgi:protease PrsW
MSQWYFQKDDKEVGPISATQLVELAGRGSLQLTTLVRRDDMTQPIQAEKVKELKAAISTSVALGQQKPEADHQIEAENLTTTDTAGASQADETSGVEPADRTVLTITENLANRVTSLAGVEKLEGFDIKELFSEVFRRHTSEEVGDYFTVGGTSTTPDITQVDTTWPRPWVFFRTFIAALLVSYGFYRMWESYENVLVLPGLLITGSFAVPIAALIFFIEVNARRNVSLYQVTRMVFAGGVISMTVSLFLFSITESLPTAWLGASIAGPVEETCKLLTLALVVFNSKYRYTLNGLLFGAAVGTGFATFESAGYAFRLLITSGEPSMMLDIIILRGVLSPFSHIAWTAMCGAALWRVKGNSRFNPLMLFNSKFLRIFVIAVGLHMAWNLPISLPFHALRLGLGAIAWTIILALVQDGLKQLRAEKVAALEKGGGAE